MLNEQMVADLSRATRETFLPDGTLKIITLVGSEQRTYIVDNKDIHAYFALLEERVYAVKPERKER